MKGLLKKIQSAKEGDKKTIQSIFYVMVALIVLSVAWAILSKSLFKSSYKRPQPDYNGSPSVSLSNSFNGIVSSAVNLVEIMEIKSSIDSLMDKDSLTSADSLRLLSAFQHLETLNRQTNQRRNEKN